MRKPYRLCKLVYFRKALFNFAKIVFAQNFGVHSRHKAPFACNGVYVSVPFQLVIGTLCGNNAYTKIFCKASY